MSFFHKWDEITQDTEPGATLPAGMSRRGIVSATSCSVCMVLLRASEPSLTPIPTIRSRS